MTCLGICWRRVGPIYLYLGERGVRVGPPATAFSIAYSSVTTGQILFKFSTCMQKPWKKFLNMVSQHFNQSKKSHVQKQVFQRGVLINEKRQNTNLLLSP